MRVQLIWIHGVCHGAKEDSWRYFFNSSRPNEQVGFVIEWLAHQHEEASQITPIVATTIEIAEPSIPMCDKGKRNIVDYMDEQQSYKF